jgi:outer membrane protein TolC
MGFPLAALPLVFAQVIGQTDPQISVEDPMLTPPTPAQQNVGSWQQVLEILRARSTDIAFARAGVVRAEAASRTALSALLPQLNGTVSGSLTPYTSQSQLANNPGCDSAPPPCDLLKFPPITYKTLASTNGSITFNQALVNIRSIYALGTARANEDVARVSEADVKRQTTLAVANAMVSVVTAERVADLNRTGLKGALERLDVAQRRRSGGAATGLDVVRAQQDVESARATLVQGDEALRQARETLGLAIGIPGQVGIAASFNAQALEEGTHTMCRATGGIDQRTDIVVAQEQAVVARRALVDAKYQFLPTLGLSSAAIAAGTQTTIALNFSSFLWTVSATLSVPIWDGGARYGALRDARGGIDQADAKLEATRRSAIVQVAQADRGVRVAQDSLEVAQRARDLAAEVDRLTRRGFAEGSGTSLELVVAAQALRQAEINLALKDFDLLRAKITAALAVANCDF